MPVGNLDRVRSLVQQASALADFTIVSCHIGAEGSTRQHITRETEMFLGEDRGNPHAFAHTAVDAGADIILCHGPHVPRAVEVYKGRFIAYSLGNFWTFGRFGLNGANGLAPIVDLRVNKAGALQSARIVSARQAKPGGPRLDCGADSAGSSRSRDHDIAGWHDHLAGRTGQRAASGGGDVCRVDNAGICRGGQDEAISRIGGAAEIAHRRIPHTHARPVAFRGNIDSAHIFLNAAIALPVGMGDQHFAITHDAADGGNMAQPHPAVAEGLHHQHGAHVRAGGAHITPMGLIPPGVGIAADLDTGMRSRERHALPLAITRHRTGFQREGGTHGKTRQQGIWQAQANPLFDAGRCRKRIAVSATVLRLAASGAR
jgi:hypothetical protein